VRSCRCGARLSAKRYTGRRISFFLRASAFAAERVARPLLVAAFGVVTLGALGAVFRYDMVAIYCVPVILVAIGGVVGFLRARRGQQGRAATAT
jgi:hypothetical protein